jgi:hypothetical protein
VKSHLCHICGTEDPTKFYGKMRGECYDCYSERKKIERKEKAVLREFDNGAKKKKQKQRKKNSPYCVICRDDDPTRFVQGVRSLCAKCLAKHII